MGFLRYLEHLGTQSDNTAIVAIVISIVSLITSIIIGILNHRRKRFETHAFYRGQVLQWYHDVTNLLCILRCDLEASEREKQLAKLSALIDLGGFYFPNKKRRFYFLNNILDKVLKRSDGLSAFREEPDRAIWALEKYRDVSEDNAELPDLLDFFQEMFTSKVFATLKPHKFNKLAGFKPAPQGGPPNAEGAKDELKEMVEKDIEELAEAYAEPQRGQTPGRQLARKLFNEIAKEKSIEINDFGWKSKDERTDLANGNFNVQRVKLAQGLGRSITLYFDEKNDVPSIYLAAGGKDGNAPFPSVSHFRGENGETTPLFPGGYKKPTVSALLRSEVAMKKFIKELKEQIDAKKEMS